MANLLRRLLSIRLSRSEFESYVANLHRHNCEHHGCHGTPSLDESRRDYKPVQERWFFWAGRV